MPGYLTKEESRIVPALDGSDQRFRAGAVVSDDEKCSGCGLCAIACPGGALSVSKEGAPKVSMMQTDLVPCLACGDCVAICEPAALELTRTVELGGFFKFLHRGAASAPRRF